MGGLAPFKLFNLGFSGDTTANTLWRLNHGEIDGMHPSRIFVLLGTNNTARKHVFWSAHDDLEGINAVVNLLRARFPDSVIYLSDLIPAEHGYLKARKDREINTLLENQYSANDGKVRLISPGKVLLGADGRLNRGLYDDEGFFIHPNAQGEKLLSEAIAQALNK